MHKALAQAEVDQKIGTLSLPIFLWTCFFVMSALHQPWPWCMYILLLQYNTHHTLICAFCLTILAKIDVFMHCVRTAECLNTY